MKRVQFVSKATAESLQGRSDTAVISINGLDPAHLRDGWHSVLRLEFDDVDVAEEPYILFNAEHARLIVEFVRECNSNGVETIIVHCNAGISRSAAVAKWIADQYGLPFPAAYMIYNKHVYRVLREAVAMDMAVVLEWITNKRDELSRGRAELSGMLEFSMLRFNSEIEIERKSAIAGLAGTVMVSLAKTSELFEYIADMIDELSHAPEHRLWLFEQMTIETERRHPVIKDETFKAWQVIFEFSDYLGWMSIVKLDPEVVNKAARDCVNAMGLLDRDLNNFIIKK